MLNEHYLIAGIEPAGIGTTGIIIKTYNGLYPRKWFKEITATNPVDAAHQIIQFIDQVKNNMDAKGYGLKAVIVEIPGERNKKVKEVKATTELIGILRYFYEGLFKGHLSQHKDKKFLEILKSKYSSSRLRDAEAILNAHLHEKQEGWTCETAWWGKKII